MFKIAQPWLASTRLRTISVEFVW